MTAKTEQAPVIENWFDFGPLLLKDANDLARLQSQTERGWDSEQETASRTIARIADMTSGWHSDYRPVVWVTADKNFQSSWYPPAVAKGRSDLQKFGKENKKTFELTEQEGGALQGYLGSFTQGDALGYEKELGNKWYLMLSWGGTLYIPVENIQEIKGIGY